MKVNGGNERQQVAHLVSSALYSQERGIDYSGNR